MDKTLAKKAESILFVKVENDGFDLGAQRRAIEKNDLTQALVILQRFKQALQSGEDPSTVLSSSEVFSMAVIATKAQMAKNGEYKLSGERYRESVVRKHQIWPIVTLDQVTEINPSKAGLKDFDEDTLVSFIPMADLDIRKANFTHDQTRKLGEVIKGYTYFSEEDILLAKITPCFENGKIGIAKNLVNKIGFGSTEFIVIRATGNIHTQFLFYLLSQPQLIEQGKAQMTGSAGQQRIPVDFIKSYKIPLPPLSIQQEIVTELENYQEVIDGARQVVENYKPTFRVDPSWDMARVGDLYEVNYGLAISIPQSLDENGIKIISTAETNLDGSLDLSEIRKIKYEKGYDKYILKPGTLLFNWRNAPKHVGKTVIFNEDTDDRYIYASFLLSLVKKAEKVEDRWAWLVLNKLREEGYFRRMSKQAVNQTNFNAELLKNTLISLPPLSIQQAIVAQIEEEQRLVEANKRLIEIFEQKIKDKIAEVWGELEASEAEVKLPLQIDILKQAQ